MGVNRSICFAAALIATLAPNQLAHAYLDPATGSMLLQVLLGGAVGALAIVRLYWSRLRSMLPFLGRRASADLGQDLSGERGAR